MQIIPLNLDSVLLFLHNSKLAYWWGLGTGAIKGWWGSCAKTRHRREIPWQPYEREPALQVATNQHHHTEATSVEKLIWPDTYHLPYPNSQLANQNPTLLSWYPTISSHWPDSATVMLNLGWIWYSKYLIVPFWYASAAYQARLVLPKYEPWLDQTCLICRRSVPKRYD